MRIAFYAPLKAPDAPVPSGDRMIARQFLSMLQLQGHDVELACRLRTFDGRGNRQRQLRLATIARRAAEILCSRIERGHSPKPDLWFTYHLYQKAPDWIGPRVAAALAIPYVIAEASVSPRAATGPWRHGHRAACAALRAADAVIGINPRDRKQVDATRAGRDGYHTLMPSLDTAPFIAAARGRDRHRAALIARIGTAPSTPIILAVAMMRSGDKARSFAVLAEALNRLHDRDWHLVVVGDGSARAEIQRMFCAMRDRVTWLGVQEADALAATYAAADLLAWPACNEALGMTLLEAQAAGVPVVAGRTDGTVSLIHEGATGIIVPAHDTEAFADAVAQLLSAPQQRIIMGKAARAHVCAFHSHDIVAAKLDDILRSLVGGERQ